MHKRLLVLLVLLYGRDETTHAARPIDIAMKEHDVSGEYGP